MTNGEKLIPQPTHDSLPPVPLQRPDHPTTQSIFRPIEFGGLEEAKVLDDFFDAMIKGVSRVKIPEILKFKFQEARQKMLLLRETDPEKGFRILKKDGIYYIDMKYLDGSAEGTIDFNKFPVPAPYQTIAQIHLHILGINKDKSESSNYQSDWDIADFAISAIDQVPIIHGVVGKDILSLSAANEVTNKKLLRTFGSTTDANKRDFIARYAKQRMTSIMHEVKTQEMAKKSMNMIMAEELQFNLYNWDYKSDSLRK